MARYGAHFLLFVSYLLITMDIHTRFGLLFTWDKQNIKLLFKKIR